MSKNKSFFQKLSDSFTSLLPFPISSSLSSKSINSNRRVASEAFGNESKNDLNESKSKRAKLYHDPMSLPASRLIKPFEFDKAISNHFNDAASDRSESSAVSVSTSGVSSLQPRRSAPKRALIDHDRSRSNIDIHDRLPLDLTPRGLNLPSTSVNSFTNRNTNDFSSNNSLSHSPANRLLSNPARKILSRLDQLSTPITGADRILRIRPNRVLSPLCRPAAASPPISARKLAPVSSVTVSSLETRAKRDECPAISNRPPRKRFGVDLDAEEDDEQQRQQRDVSHKRSRSTNTAAIDGEFEYIIGDYDENLSEIDNINRLIAEREAARTNEDEDEQIEFSFRPPTSIDSPEYRLSNGHAGAARRPYRLQSIVEPAAATTGQSKQQIDRSLWRCNTCFSENGARASECASCGNLPRDTALVLAAPVPAPAAAATIEPDPVTVSPVATAAVSADDNKPPEPPAAAAAAVDHNPVTVSPVATEPAAVFKPAPITTPSPLATTSVSASTPFLFAPTTTAAPASTTPFSFCPAVPAASKPAAPFLFGTVSTTAPASSAPFSFSVLPATASIAAPLTFCAASTAQSTAPAFSLPPPATQSIAAPFQFSAVSTTPSSAPFSFNLPAATPSITFGPVSSAPSIAPFSFAPAAIATPAFSFSSSSGAPPLFQSSASANPFSAASGAAPPRRMLKPRRPARK